MSSEMFPVHVVLNSGDKAVIEVSRGVSARLKELTGCRDTAYRLLCDYVSCFGTPLKFQIGNEHLSQIERFYRSNN